MLVPTLEIPVVLILPPVILALASSVVAEIFVVVKLPDALIVPLMIKLPPVTLPVTLTPPAPPTMLPAALILPPEIFPVAVIKPPVLILPPVTLPVAVTSPAVETLPPATLPTMVRVEDPYMVPVTANVCNGAEFATPTLPVAPSTTIRSVKLAPLAVWISTFALPPASAYTALTAAVTRGPAPVASEANHSNDPMFAPSELTAVFESVNRMVGDVVAVDDLVRTILPVVIFKLPPSTLPVALTRPPVLILAPVILPLALDVPVTAIPALLATNTLAVPLTLIFALPLATGISMLVVPLKILSPEMLPVSATLPETVKLPSMITVAVLAVRP